MNATTEFSGRSAFVTGAGTGIGAATAAELAARGAKVAMMGRRAGKLEEAAAAIRAAGGEVLILIGDVAKAKDVADAVGKTPYQNVSYLPGTYDALAAAVRSK